MNILARLASKLLQGVRLIDATFTARAVNNAREAVTEQKRRAALVTAMHVAPRAKQLDRPA